MKRALFCFSLFNLWFSFSYGQSRKIDSLKNLIQQSKSDTERIRHLNELSYFLNDKNPDTAIILAQQVMTICDELVSSSHRIDETHIKILKAIALTNKGISLFMKSDYSNALKSYLDALKIRDELSTGGIGTSEIENNIGNIYLRQNNFKDAIKYFLMAINESAKAGDKNLEELAYDNLGMAYENEGNHDEAIQYMLKSKNLSEEIKDEYGVSTSLLNIGNVYDGKGNVDSALVYYNEAIKIKIRIGDKEGVAICEDNMGKDYFVKRKFKEAIDELQASLKGAREIGEKLIVQDIYENFAVGYKMMNEYKLAFDYQKKYSNITDTIFNEQSAQQTAQAQAQYDTEKKQKQIELLKKDKEKQAAVAEAEQHKKRVIFIAGTAIILLLGSFSFFMYNRFVLIRKQKGVIEEQKLLVDEKNKRLEEVNEIIDEKNKDIVASIRYAKRLQDAILPPMNTVKKHLPESFVFYKPKDIVAGDFYWMYASGESVFIAACDCTGHGVPGAMVSVVCSNALNRTVKEFKITEPGKILDKVRELVVETFEKSESEVQDGMDVSLCCLNTQTKEIQWSGANNPLWYIQGNELKEVAPDKQPIGKFNLFKPFNTTGLKLQKGDTLYLFTDGYADQFGGPKGKKFKYKQLQDKLLAIVNMSIDSQKEILDKTLEAWKGGLEQVDDVLVIGIRV